MNYNKDDHLSRALQFKLNFTYMIFNSQGIVKLK